MVLPPSLLPIAFALVAGFLFGVASVVAKRGLAYVDPHLGVTVSITTTFLIYFAFSPLWMRAEYWFSPGFWVFVLGGFFHPLLSMYLVFEATARAGPTIAATFAATAPLFASAAAIAFLGESLTLLIALGTIATVAGIMAITRGPGGVPRLVRVALLLASGTAMIRGANHALGKLGLDLLPSVQMASFVNFGVSSLGAIVIYRYRHGRLPLAIPRAGLVPFLITGTMTSVAILCMYSALHHGDVVIVSPIVNTYPLFALASAVALREERASQRLVAGVLLVVIGVTCIAMEGSG